jgi:predicted  nucleic acid-binding Zn-ribbon protein
MVRVSDLYALQLVDSEIDGLEQELAGLRARQGEDEELVALREQIPELEETARGAEKEQRESEVEVEDGNEKVSAVESKLYSGTVTNTKELRDLQRELELLQRQQRAREDRELQAMVRADDARTAAVQARETLEQGLTAWQTDQERLAEQIAELERRVAGLREDRAKAQTPIDAPTLGLYERLRRTRAGRAVARVQGGACLGCRIALPSTIFQRARSGMAVVQCSSCERILYVG